MAGSFAGVSRVIAAAIMATGLSGIGAGAVSAADAEAGATVFKKCVACHSLKAGKKKVGPSLHGLFGRTAGTFVDGKGKAFKHSQDLAEAGQKGLVWNAETFAGYIADPKPFIGKVLSKDKGKTKMAFPGLKNPTDVANLVAFIEPYAKGEKEGDK
jgi:cytochrome c